jgi:hypothetical protein
VTPGGGAGFGARGRRLVTFAPGRLGHHACRHHDRHARCSLQPEPAPRETPDGYGARSAKPGPTLSLWMRESRGREPQWNAGRRVRPQHLWVATSEGVAHAAPAGAVPHPHDADRQALSLPRVCRRSASFLFFLSFVCAAPDRDGSGPPLPDRSDEGRVFGGGVFGLACRKNSDANKKRAAGMNEYCRHPEVRAEGAPRRMQATALQPCPSSRAPQGEEIGVRFVEARASSPILRAAAQRGPHSPLAQGRIRRVTTSGAQEE